MSITLLTKINTKTNEVQCRDDEPTIRKAGNVRILSLIALPVTSFSLFKLFPVHIMKVRLIFLQVPY